MDSERAENEMKEKPEEHQKPEPESERTNILKTVISLAVYVAVYYILFRGHLSYILLLVIVIFLHELGHFIAMKKFGYRDVQMFFVPFMGAYVSGEPHHVSQYQKVITLLAGPLPGIILGIICGWLYIQTSHPFYFQSALLLLLLNVFNLLPVSPLDGGQLLETIFFESNRTIQAVFIILSSALLAYFAFRMHQYLFLILVPLLLLRLRSINSTARIRKVLDEKQIDYHKSYEALSNETYWAIRKEMIPYIRLLHHLDPDEADENESAVISYMKPILKPDSESDLNPTQKFLVLFVWMVGLFLPVILFFTFNFNYRIKI